VTDVEGGELAALLDDVRRELGQVVDELDRSRDAHRHVESLLLAVLEHVPVPVVVVDQELRVRAASTAAESAWGATLDRPVAGLDAFDGSGLNGALRAWFDAGYVAAGSVPDGFGAAMLEEPGTGVRYIAAWAG
jgi:nitrogen fixation/metabolism regulation signal transduction histidine kinase